MTNERSWDKQQVTLFVKQAKSRVGADGWLILVPKLRVALIRAEALLVVTSQASETVSVRAVDLLCADMLEAAGLAG